MYELARENKNGGIVMNENYELGYENGPNRNARRPLNQKLTNISEPFI